MRNLDGGLKVMLVGIVLAVASGCATKPVEQAPEPDTPPAAKEAMPEPEPQPEPEPMVTPTPAAEPEMRVVEEEGLTTYTVVSGDNLWDISSYRVIYGNPYQWPLIYKANTDQIDDADLIFPNQVLVIPRDSSASEIDAAIHHARNRGAWTLGVAEESDLAYLNQ
ncbi:MAG: LysM peptidoglycan-binding domain-containing protein [Acidiferrobacterales bacterium]